MVNKDKYIGKFIDEGFENLAVVEKALFELKDGLSLEDNMTALLRALHTLKGSARLLEFKNIEAVAHAAENLFISFKEQRVSISDRHIQLILVAADALKRGFATIRETKVDSLAAADYERNLNLAASNDDFEIPARLPSPLETAEPVGSLKPAGDGSDSAERKDELLRSDSIRISLDKIDDIIKNMASLQAIEISAKNIAAEVETIREKARAITKTFERSQGSAQDGVLASLSELDRALADVVPKLKNYAVDAGNLTKGAYNSVLLLRMLPLSIIFDSYPRYVFELATELKKKVDLVIEGKENEIDKNIIELLSDVFLHILRNAIDHGIEGPEERLAAGKKETGTVRIKCSQESGNMKIVVSDDGRGLSYEKIRAKAVSLGLVSKEDAEKLGNDELANFIFQSGFSTNEEANHISGRGVGMDVVRYNIERMKGSVVMDSESGKGTTFTIVVPLSVASLMGFPIASGSMRFIIPANFVSMVMLVRPSDIIEVVDRPAIKLADKIVMLYYLNQVLRIEDTATNEREAFFIVVVNAYEETIAIAVDSITSMKSVILKSLPAFMENLRVFSGAVLSEDYDMVPVLHVPTVIKMAKRLRSIDIKKRYVDAEKTHKNILVVDDSLPTREIEQELLEAQGYRVDIAADGVEALTLAKTRHYDLICTDLNMPQMDGFMLTENLRRNESFKLIPIIVISSRANEDAKKRAFALGADRYIVKSSFNNYNLIDTVRELIGEA